MCYYLNMEQIIKDRLDKIEQDYNVKILFAVESGSRAWGFSSINSDYDVRFVYINKPEWYAKVFPGRDVIEVMDKELNLDFSGWDLRKALGLLYKGNPPILEWFSSPIIYKQNNEAISELKILTDDYYDVKSSIYHYLHMAQGNYKAYIRERDEVILKKYLYITRPLLACYWLRKYQQVPPMEMDIMLVDFFQINPFFGATIKNIVEEKKKGSELGLSPANTTLNLWIEEQLEENLKYVESLHGRDKDATKLDAYLYKWINKF